MIPVVRVRAIMVYDVGADPGKVGMVSACSRLRVRLGGWGAAAVVAGPARDHTRSTTRPRDSATLRLLGIVAGTAASRDTAGPRRARLTPSSWLRSRRGRRAANEFGSRAGCSVLISRAA